MWLCMNTRVRRWAILAGAQKAPTVSLTTVTLDDLLARAGSPSFYARAETPY